MILALAMDDIPVMIMLLLLVVVVVLSVFAMMPMGSIQSGNEAT
jgi:hypothetical protein